MQRVIFPSLPIDYTVYHKKCDVTNLNIMRSYDVYYAPKVSA